MNQPAIDIQGLERRFGTVTAVDGLDLRVEPGQVYGLLGRNGAGKTTTLNTMLGFLAPSAGSVRLLGLDPLQDDLALKRRLGYVPEDLAAYPWMRVGEITRFSAAFHDRWDHGRVEGLIDRFELPRERKVRQLSKGMRAQLLLALALGHHPELLLLDEAGAGLDPLVRQQWQEVLIEVAQDDGTTIFTCSHLVDEVERIADRIGVLVGGRLVVDEELDGFKARCRQVRLWYDGQDSPTLPPAHATKRDGRSWLLDVRDFGPDWEAACRATEPDRMEIVERSLQDLVVDHLASPSSLEVRS
ncbi:MAG: ABC transporter ATP-binding protein [Acidobacteriota bacterium]